MVREREDAGFCPAHALVPGRGHLQCGHQPSPPCGSVQPSPRLPQPWLRPSMPTGLRKDGGSGMAGLVTLEAQLPPAGSWEDASSKNHRPWLGGTPPQTPASQRPALICSLGARLVLGQAGACSRVRWSLGGLPRSLEGGGPRSRRGGEPGLAVQAGSPGKAPVKDRPDEGVCPAGSPLPAPLEGGVLSLVLGLQDGGELLPALAPPWAVGGWVGFSSLFSLLTPARRGSRRGLGPSR